MIDIEYKDETYTLPTKPEEIKLGKYIEIIRLDKDLSGIERTARILSILTDMGLDDIKNISVDQIGAMSNHIQFLFKNTNRLLVDQIKVGNKWYGFNKNLNHITFGEYIDLQTFSSREKIENNLHILMAILYRPIKMKKKSTTLKKFIENYIYVKDIDTIMPSYEIEEYNEKTLIERADLFRKEMTLDIVMGAMFFFLILKLMLIENLNKSLNQKEMMTMVIEKMKALGVDFKPTGGG